MVSSSNFQKCQLKVNFIDKNKQTPVTGGVMNISIFSIYQQKPVQQLIYVDSGEKSEVRFYFIVIQSNLVAGGYVAGGYGYFNDAETDYNNNPAITLDAQNEFIGKMTVGLIPANVTQVIKGQVVDEVKKGVSDALIVLSIANPTYPHSYPEQQGKSDQQGKFSFSSVLPASPDYVFSLVVTHDRFQGTNTTCTQWYNLNNSDMTSYTQDVGQLVLIGIKQVKKLKVQGTIYDKTKIVNTVPGVEVSLVFDSKDKVDDAVAKTDGKGHYQFLVELDGKQKYSFSVKAGNKEFATVQSQEESFELDDDKDYTIDLYLERNTLLVSLEQGFPEIESASVELVSSKPDMKEKDAKYYKQSKAIASHEATFAFVCYVEVKYTVSYSISAPKFQSIQTDSSPFVCSSQTIKLPPSDVSLKKEVIEVTLEGLVVDPEGKPKDAVDVSVSTSPATTQMTARTGKDGKFKVETEQLNVGGEYKVTTSYKNDVKQAVAATQDIKLTSEKTQKFELSQIDYQGLVESTLAGTLTVSDQPQAKQTVTATCTSLGHAASGSAQTSDKGEFKISMENLAQYQQAISCQLDSKSTQYSEIKQADTLKGPSFSDKDIQLKGSYGQQTYAAQGFILDATQIVQFVQGATVSLQVSPKDDFLKANPSAVSNASGVYTVQFPGVQNTKYQAVYTVQQPDFVSQTSAQLPIGQPQNFTLKRQTLKVQIQTSTVDQTNSPIANGQIILNQTTPSLASPTTTPLASTGPDGSCSFTVECYKNVEYNISLTVENPTVYPTSLAPLTFNCSSSPQKIPPLQGDVTHSFKNAYVEIDGQVLNYLGKGDPGMALVFSTNPVTGTVDAKTDKDGKFKAEFDYMTYNQSYELIASYSNPKKQTETTTMKIKSASNETVRFPTIYSQSEVNLEIQGNLNNKEYSIKGSGIVVTADCNSTSQTVTSDANGNYDLKIKETVKMNDTFSCTLQTQQNDKFQSSSQSVEEKPPSFSSKVDINLNLTDKFKKMINNYYQEVNLVGQAMTNECKKGSEDHIPLSNATAQLFQYNGNEYLELPKEDETDANGVFSMKLVILKIRLQELFEVKVSKEGYYSQVVYFRPQADEVYQDGQYYVDLGIIPITPVC